VMVANEIAPFQPPTVAELRPQLPELRKTREKPARRSVARKWKEDKASVSSILKNETETNDSARLAIKIY
jgi:hypothetical protein